MAGHPASFLGCFEGNPAALQPVAAAVVAAAGPNAADHTVAAAAAAAAAAHTVAVVAAAAASEVLENSQQAGSAGVQKAAAAHPGSALETAKPRMLAAKPVCSAAAPAGQLQPALATKQNHVGLASVGSGTALAADHQTAPKPHCWGS